MLHTCRQSILYCFWMLLSLKYWKSRVQIWRIIWKRWNCFLNSNFLMISFRSRKVLKIYKLKVEKFICCVKTSKNATYRTSCNAFKICHNLLSILTFKCSLLQENNKNKIKSAARQKQREKNTESDKNMNQQCKVCGEPAAGFHFGAFTCEGCKVSVSRYQQYII